MPAKQHMALSIQTERNALDASPVYMFYPLKGKLEPQPEYTEETENEWRGSDTGQGNTGDNEERTSTSQKYPWESRVYPGQELVTLFQFLFGTYAAGVALSAPDAAAKRYMFCTTTEMYGEGTTLLNRALALIPNTRKGASTYSQNYLGHRPKDLELNFEGGKSVTMKMNFMSGSWIGPPEQPATSGVSFPTKPFRSLPKIYLGTGATLTGSAPLYTDFAPGTMVVAKPDDFNVKYDVGIEDVWKDYDNNGPSVTERKKPVSFTFEFTIDFTDPSSGWSSYDAWVAQFSGITYAPFMLTLDGPVVLAGCTNQKAQLAFYLPRVKVTTDAADRKNDGSKDKIKVKLESRVDPSVNVAAIAKLIC